MVPAVAAVPVVTLQVPVVAAEAVAPAALAVTVLAAQADPQVQAAQAAQQHL